MTNTDQAIRDANLAHIKKVMRSKGAKEQQWPGAPLGHFGILGEESRVMRDMIKDGSVVIVERPKKVDPTQMAVFVCLPR